LPSPGFSSATFRRPPFQAGRDLPPFDGVDVALTGTMLDASYGIAVRTGLHCAPWAHRAIGTLPEGTIRASLGPFNSGADVAALVSAVREMAA